MLYSTRGHYRFILPTCSTPAARFPRLPNILCPIELVALIVATAAIRYLPRWLSLPIKEEGAIQ